MAQVIVISDNNRYLEDAEAFYYLKERGIGYERWDTWQVPQELRTFRKLTEDEQNRLLSVWGRQLERLMESNGYTQADVVAVSPETVADLDAALADVRTIHHHTEDEVRFVVSGHGVFGIELDCCRFEVYVHDGDLLTIPKGTWHWFDLAADRRIQCIRLFRDASGWAPHYRSEQAAHRR